MTRKADKEYHWAGVAGCLVLFHGFSKQKARKTVADYQAWWESRPGSREQKRARDIIYHEEPYDAACRLAGIDDVHFKEGWDTYMQFMEAEDPFGEACRLLGERQTTMAGVRSKPHKIGTSGKISEPKVIKAPTRKATLKSAKSSPKRKRAAAPKVGKKSRARKAGRKNTARKG